MTNAIAQPRASGLYHGWKVLIALFLAGFFVYGGGLYCFVLFVTPLTAEFGWSRASTGGIVSAFWLSSPLLLVGGYAIRRFGVTRMLAAGITIEAVCVIALASVSTLPQMYLLRGAMGFGKILFAACIPVTCARWFSRHFGLALGIAWAGWHIGGMVLAPITGAIIAEASWRTACVWLGIALLVLALLPLLLTARRTPRPSWATWIGLAVMAMFSFERKTRTRFQFYRQGVLSWRLIKSLLSLSVPGGIATMAVMTGFLIFIKVVARLDGATTSVNGAATTIIMP